MFKKKYWLNNALLKFIFFLLTLFIINQRGTCQGLYPIQSNVQLIPPYSTYLTDYAQPGSEKFRVILLQRDISQAGYQVRLRFSIILDGKTIMVTSRSYNPPPLTLSQGIPITITGADLADYLDSRYLDFVGYDRNLYERTKSLPEGSFQICVTAYDYHNQNIQISNVGCSFYYLAKNEPPLINQPACGSRILKKEPQQIFFMWLPRNTSSPNSAANTEYIFQLFENRVAGKNPNDIALSQPPIFTTTTDLPQIIYGPAEPQLLENMQYVWRVQAKDKGGKDDFRNNGYSEVCTFTYGGENVQDIGLVKEFNAEGVNERVGRMHWKIEPDIFDSYRINYKKTSSPDGQWGIAESTTSEVTVNTLEAGTEYDTRIQGKKNGFYGNYSSIITFKTPVHKEVNCNPVQNRIMPDMTKPLLDGIKGTMVNVDGMDMMLLEIENLGNGYYKGRGKVYIDFLGGGAFAATFEKIYIDQNKVVGEGKISLVSSGANYVKNSNDPLSHQNKLELKGDLKTLVQELKGIDTASAPTLIRWIETIESVTQETIGNTLVLTKAEKDKFTQTQKDLTEAKANLKSKPTDVTVINNVKNKIKEATPALTKMSQYLGKGLWLSLGLIKEKAVEEILQGFEKDIEVYLKIPESERNSKTRGPADEENNFRLNLPICLQDKSNEELKRILVSIDNELKIEKKNERPFTKMVLDKYPDFYKDLENTVKPKLKSETDKIEEKADAGQWTKNKENVCSVFDKLGNTLTMEELMPKMPDYFKQKIIRPDGKIEYTHEDAILIQNEQDQTIAYILPDEKVFFWVYEKMWQGYFENSTKTQKSSYLFYVEDKYMRHDQPVSWGIYLAAKDLGGFAINLVESPIQTSKNLATGIYKIATLQFDIEKTWQRVINADKTDGAYVVATLAMGYLAGPKGKAIVAVEDAPRFGEMLGEYATKLQPVKLTWPQLLVLFRKAKQFEALVTNHLKTLYPIEQGYTILKQVYVKVDGVMSVADNIIYNSKTGQFILNETKYGVSNTLRKNQKIIQDAIKAGKEIEIRTVQLLDESGNIIRTQSDRIKVFKILRSNSIDGTINTKTVTTIWP